MKRILIILLILLSGSLTIEERSIDQQPTTDSNGEMRDLSYHPSSDWFVAAVDNQTEPFPIYQVAANGSMAHSGTVDQLPDFTGLVNGVWAKWRPAGDVLYVALDNPNAGIGVYDFDNSTGAATRKQTFPLDNEGGNVVRGDGAAFTPDGNWLLAGVDHKPLRSYAVAADGTLTNGSYAPDWPAGEGFNNASTNSIAISKDGNLVFVNAITQTTETPILRTYRFHANGTFTNVTNYVGTSPEYARAFAPSYDNNYLAVGNTTSILTYNVSANGTTTFIEAVNVGDAVSGAVFASTDDYLFAVVWNNASYLRGYLFNQGTLTLNATPDNEPNPGVDTLGLSPNDGFLAIGTFSAPQLVAYQTSIGVADPDPDPEPDTDSGSTPIDSGGLMGLTALLMFLAWITGGLDQYRKDGKI